jgi:hypothetical protein
MPSKAYRLQMTDEQRERCKNYDREYFKTMRLVVVGWYEAYLERRRLKYAERMADPAVRAAERARKRKYKRTKKGRA